MSEIIKITCENSYASISTHGAEVHEWGCGDKQYVWNGDKEYWNRHTPILFPIVGKVWKGEYRVDGETFHLPQHGFARDAEFKVVDTTEDRAIFELESSEETRKVYPYDFKLRVTYTIDGKYLVCAWEVINPTTEPIYAQIGAHPAFLYKNFQKGEIHGYFQLLKGGKPLTKMTVSQLGESGCFITDKYEQELEDGIIALGPDTFLKDALVLEDSQCDETVLLDKEKKPIMSLFCSDAEVLGLWSPPGKDAPFVCIEPWRGRADYENFEGDYRDKPWVRKIEAGGMLKFNFIKRAIE